ncbi:hypothetical protein HYV11_01005 [Candidatus Dependentiae bacterium]|nr:hypothetical protein [Candidatus Dependentiae bacterium]
MIKKIFFFSFIIWSWCNSSPRCIGFPANQHFRKSSYQYVDCSCPCTYRSAHIDKYECKECKHRLIPQLLEKDPLIIIALQKKKSGKKET